MIRIFRKIIALVLALALLPAWPTSAGDASSAPSGDSTSQSGRAELDNILVGPDQVQLHLSRPAKYNTFTTANPPRIILEILQSNVRISPSAMAGQGTDLKRVRAGQFQGEPDPITRVVLDLRRLVRYTVTPDANMILVKLESEPSTPAAGTSVPATSAETPVPATPAKAVAAAPANAPTVPQAATAPQTASTSTQAALPPESLSMQTTKQMAQPAMANELNAMATQHTATTDRDAAAAAPVEPPVVYGEGATPFVKSAHDILANLPKDRVSLDLQDTDIGDVLKLMAAKANTNVIYGNDVTGTVSLHLNNVPFDEAFSVVLGLKSLMVYQAGENTLRVVTAKQLQNERTNTVGVSQVFKIYYQDAGDIKKELDSVRQAEKRQGQSVLDVKNNEIILTDSPDGLASAERLISQLDVRPQQVLIETKLVEVSLTRDFEIGVQWGLFGAERGHIANKQGTTIIGGGPTFNQNTFGLPLDQNTLSVPQPVPIGALGQGTGVNLTADKVFGALTLGRVTNNMLLNATLTAAANKGKAKVLSDPKIATLNGKQATINITTQLPFATTNTSATGATTTTINYTTTGIQLTVTPTVNADGRITLHLVPNISKPSSTVATGGAASAGAISTDTRNADTNVVVRDGETIVIGGIITDSVSDSIAKVPFFGDIPLLGWLFKKKTTSRSRVELLIFVTTKLLAD